MLKYPLILVHGIILKDIKFIKAFGRIEKYLNNQGVLTFTSKTDGFGSISNNAIMLKEQIDGIMVKYNVDKVNLICHSKGGLDAKYLINELSYGNHVASYTTLNTPHKGSVLADKILTLPKFLTKALSVYINILYKIFGDKHPDSYRVCMELTEEAQDNVKLNYNDIFVMSYSTTMSKRSEDFIVSIPFSFFNHFSSDLNDGAVSVESQKYLNYMGNTNNLSHREITGFMVGKKKRERIFKFYDNLVNILREHEV